MTRIAQKFTQLQGKTAFIPYICAGHPNYETSLEILKNLPKAGADIIELGVPFLDPAGDGPIIEDAAKTAIKNGATLKNTLKMVGQFRKNDQTTPILLMGYYNSFLKYGFDNFCQDAKSHGVDAVLITDLPSEEQHEIAPKIKESNLDFINLISPISDENRIRQITANNSSGFLYLLSFLGITGTKDAQIQDNKINLQRVKSISNLPICIGFGIKTPEQAGQFAKIGFDGVVVGSAIVKMISEGKNIDEILKLAKNFNQNIKNHEN